MEELNPIQDMQKYDGRINTLSGKVINLLDPKPEEINIEDIARGLAYNCHFGGHTPKFFSIAQHCLMVVQMMKEDNCSTELMMAGLLHDAAEAYLGDVVKPLKVELDRYQEIENKMLSVIFEKYNINYSNMPLIKIYDIEVQKMEFFTFYKGGNEITEFLDPEQSRELFLKIYEELDTYQN